MSIRTRFAPSPTGYVHVGSLRTALYCYLLAKKHNGSYILRIEDTDRTRYVEGSIENLLDAMQWSGVQHDEGVFLEDGKRVQHGEKGPYIQSERLEIYDRYTQELLDKGKAYRCFCSKERLDALKEEGVFGYDGKCRSLSKEESERRKDAGEEYVVRLKMPEDENIVIDDIVRGKVVMNTKESDDQVLRKSDGYPTYHLAVVVDDHLMDITHVIRGEEWLSSTPKHIVLYHAFGWDVPKYAHLPNILGDNRKKLSKRTGDVSVSVFKEKGYLPEALVNFLALVGWSPEGNKEIMSMDELVEAFSLDRVNVSPGVFDIKKLKYINNAYIKQYENEKLLFLLKEREGADREILLGIIDLVKEKADTLLELDELIDTFYVDELVLEEGSLESLDQDSYQSVVEDFLQRIQKDDSFSAESIKANINACKELGVKGKQLFMPIRVSITGQTHGSDLARTIYYLGKQRVLGRMKNFMEKTK